MSHPLFDVTGRVALVTGSSRGIGRALATGLAEAGARVVLNGRDADRLRHVAAEIETATGAPSVATAAFDVTDSDAVRAAVERVETEVGPIAICVNNAGVQQRQPMVDFSDQEWDRIIAGNLTSVFYVGREVGRRMVQRGAGRIVNIASLQSEVARAGIAPYAASKGGVKMLTKGMCAEFAGSGVCVNAIGPGYIDTELTAALVQDPEFSRWVRRRTPAGRWGRVEDLVGALLFLASDASAYVNGQVVYVDGGGLAVM